MKYNCDSRFWKQHPALLYSLAALMGVCLPTSLVFIPLFILFRIHWKSLLMCAVVGLAAFFYLYTSYTAPLLPLEGVKGKALISVNDISPTRTPFSNTWTYRGTLHSFYDELSGELIAKNVPLSITLPRSGKTPGYINNYTYQIEGKLKKSHTLHYRLAPSKKWKQIEKNNSLMKIRFLCKEKVKKYIHQHIPSKRAATFLIGIATGHFDDYLMGQELGRFGLQHIMAISGFHFSVVVLFISYLLRLCFPLNWGPRLLFIFLLLYFLFLGSTASILRAWITASIVILGIQSGKISNALNSLGVALLGLIVLDPTLCFTLGFQLSFIITASILVFFHPILFLLEKIYPRRVASEMLFFDRMGYRFLTFIKNGLALTLAVNISALPLSLFYFYKFPLMALFYNLFYPFLVSFSIFLLIIGTLTHFSLIHLFNAYFTESILSLVYNVPLKTDYMLRIHLSSEGVFIYFALIFYLGVWVRARWEENLRLRENLTFL